MTGEGGAMGGANMEVVELWEGQTWQDAAMGGDRWNETRTNILLSNDWAFSIKSNQLVISAEIHNMGLH